MGDSWCCCLWNVVQEPRLVASQMTDEEGKRRVIQPSAIQRPFVSRKKDEKFEKGLNIY